MFVTLTFLIPLLLTFTAAAILMSGFLNIDQKYKHQCRQELIEVQESNAKMMRALFAMNPIALALKIAYETERLRLLAAAAAGQKTMVLYHIYRIYQISQRRKHLDRAQQAILKAAHALNRGAVWKIRFALQRSAMTHPTGRVFSMSMIPLESNSHGLAVRPKTQDVAPEYEPESSFEEKQSLSLSWKVKFRSGETLRTSLPFRFEWKRYCGVTLRKEGSHWKSLIEMDKLYWSLR